ncbi:MAG TPA: PQ-loop repeat-containing protein [Candidatus Babeliales bacterium]|nr:PQ-loop repeat-containing protein [Candidatus Babeliales bacterium]
MFNYLSIGTAFVTISWLFMLYSMIPQIILNYRLANVHGLSDMMLTGNLIMNLCGIFFIFCCELPLVYQLLGSVGFLLFLVVLVQRIFYDWPRSTYFFIVIASIISLFASSIPLVMRHPYFYGSILGWFGFWAQFLYLFPQLIKIIQTKSVEGFSFAFITLLTLANLFELIGALILNLPFNIIANDIRGLMMYVLFCILFGKYRKTNDKDSNGK